MCGIVGMLTGSKNGFDSKEMDAFKEMLYADAVRGPDSTGLFSVSNKGNVKWAKAALLPAPFLERDAANEVLKNAYARGSALVGHNRKATIGKIQTNTAHPFAEGNTILIHNGTLRNHYSLMSFQKREERKITVDSHVMAYLFEHDDWKKVLNELDGAYTFVWYNATEQKLRIIRNHERPLAWVVNKQTETLFFASEMGMLYWILGRHGLMQQDKFSSGYFKEKQLYEYSLQDGGGWKTEYLEVFPKKEEEPSAKMLPVQVETKKPAEKSPAPKVVHVNHAPVHLPSTQKGIPDKFKANIRGYETIDVATIDPFERIMFHLTDYAPHSNGKSCAWRIKGEEVNSTTEHSIRGTFIGDGEVLKKGLEGRTCFCGFVKSVAEDKDGRMIIAVTAVEVVDHPIEYADAMLIHPDLHNMFMADESMCSCHKKTGNFLHLAYENLWFACEKCDDTYVVEPEDLSEGEAA